MFNQTVRRKNNELIGEQPMSIEDKIKRKIELMLDTSIKNHELIKFSDDLTVSETVLNLVRTMNELRQENNQ